MTDARRRRVDRVTSVFRVTVTNDGDEPAFMAEDIYDLLSEADVQPYIENVEIAVGPDVA